MDVVNGKIVSVSSRTERSDLWSAMRPSGSGLEGRGQYPHGMTGQLGNYNSWGGRRDWAGPSGFNSGSLPPPHRWGASAPSHERNGPETQKALSSMAPSMAPEPGTGRWNRSPRDHVLGQPHKKFAGHSPYGGESPPHPTSFVSKPTFQPGWKRSSGAITGSIHPTRPWTHSALLDEEMTMFESQICRDVSDNFESQLVSVSVTPRGSFSPGCSVAQDSTPAAPDGTAEEVQETRAGADTLKSQRMELSENAQERVESGIATNIAKRRKIEFSENDQDDCAWIAPLRFLIRKGLSVSDVGQLGRIVLPKKDAEGQLPQIDTKEGKLLEMDDYSNSKRWFFRYKFWINNKSRMYVLENTGEFIKHHGLKERDSLVVYEDGVGKLVVHGEKKTTSRLGYAIDPSKPGSSNVENSNSDKPSTTTEEEICRVTRTIPLATFALD